VRKLLVMTAVVGLAGAVCAAEAPALKTQKQKVGYCIGLSIGRNLKDQALDVDLETFVQGIKDALSGAKAAMTPEEMRATMQAFEKEARAKDEERSAMLAEKNKKEGEAFLAENKKKEGVVALPSGLQYKILKAGTGKTPKATDEVSAHYRGTLIDGTEFDSSHSRGEPATFPVEGVIKGWVEALQLMQVGAKWQLVIPAELAYGDRGAGRVIGPNATLIFELELISIQGK